MNRYKNILVPVDFSDMGRKAVKKAQDFLGTDSELVVAHIIDYVPPPYVAVEMPAAFSSGDFMKEKAGKQLEKMCEELNISFCTKIVEVGNARTALVKLAQDHDIDLVVMGKHNNPGLLRALGSTTNYVVQNLASDVLVLHGE